MSAFSRFLDQQQSLGRAALVAFCLASPSVAFSSDLELKATVYTDEGPIVQTFSDNEVRERIVEVTKNVDRNLNAIGLFLQSLQVVGESSISAEAKLAKFKVIAEGTLEVLNENRNFRYDFSTLQAAPDDQTIRNIDLLTARSNRLNEFINDMEMTLQEFEVAIDQGNYQGIDKVYFKIASAYDNEQSLERQMRDIGFDPTAAAKSIR